MDATLPAPLSAKHADSIAYRTVRDKLPIICTKATDFVHRQHTGVMHKYGQAGENGVKFIVRTLSKLRYEVMTDKPVSLLADQSPDTEEWNRSLQEMKSRNGGKPISWFSGPWLYMECYMYRRMQEGIRLCSVLNFLDVFEEQKRETFRHSIGAITSLMTCLLHVINHSNLQPAVVFKVFKQFVQAAVWGSRAELSVWGGQGCSHHDSLLGQLDYLSPHLLVDHTDAAFHALNGGRARRGGPGKVDIVLNNVGLELVADLCLADFLLSAGLATSIHLHGKAMPWCVTDVTRKDFDWTLDQAATSSDSAVSPLGQRWREHLHKGTWSFLAEDFWTLPYDYSRMEAVAPELYRDLEEADMIIFKGNLNYRKLVGDLDWDPTTSFQRSLRGFQPASLCVLRTLRADVVTGLKDGQAAHVASKDMRWKLSGNWAVVQVSLSESRKQSLS